MNYRNKRLKRRSLREKAGDIRQFIQDRLRELGDVIAYDDFSELAFVVGRTYGLNAEQASKLINDNLAGKRVGSQEYATHGVSRDNLWQGQDEVVNFSKTDPGELAEPLVKRAFKEGDVVHVNKNPEPPWGADYIGVIININDDGTFDVLDTNKQVQKGQSAKLFSKPFGTGRPTAPPQASRIGDNYGEMDSPSDVGDAHGHREHPGLYQKPRGHETDNVVNPKSPYIRKSATLTYFPKLTGKWAKINLSSHLQDASDINKFEQRLEELRQEHRSDYLFGGLLEDREALVRSIDGDTANIIHLGIDYWVPADTEVAATMDGEVVHVLKDSDPQGGWGGRVTWKLPSGKYLIYGHLDHDITVKVGDQTKSGDIIGKVGKPPLNGGMPPHLHVQQMTAEEVAPFKNNLALIDGYGRRPRTATLYSHSNKEWYANRLEDPSLVNRAFYVNTSHGPKLVVPIGGSRKMGLVDGEFDKEEANRIAQDIQDKGIFSLVIQHPSLDEYEVFYGDELVIKSYAYGEGMDPGKAFGYSEKAQKEFENESQLLKKPLYVYLRQKIVLEYGKEVAAATDRFLKGQATPPKELQTVLCNYGLKL